MISKFPGGVAGEGEAIARKGNAKMAMEVFMTNDDLFDLDDVSKRVLGPEVRG